MGRRVGPNKQNIKLVVFPRNTEKVALTQTAINHQVCGQNALCTASQSTRKRYYEKTGLRRQESKTVSLFTLYLL